MFDLKVEGIQNFHRLDGVLVRRKIARDPLQGLVNGVNKTFFTNYFPIYTSGSVSVFADGVPISGSIDTDTGEITTGSAPEVQPVATYTFTPYNTSDQLSFLIQGFMAMEGFWHRGFRLVDSVGNPATEDSDFIYLTDGSGGDPLTGRWSQLNFYMACVRYAYLTTQLTTHAIQDFSWRETVRGMMIDKSRVPTNLAEASKLAKDFIDASREAANIDWYPDGSNYGALILNPVTADYAVNFAWQVDAELANTRSLLGSSRVLIF